MPDMPSPRDPERPPAGRNDPESPTASDPLRPGPRGVLQRLLARFEIDRAVFYALLLRGWQFGGGLVSVLLISVFFTEEVQGYYYTFTSLIGLQAFFELGFGVVIRNVCSHEWAALELNEDRVIVGDSGARSRLASVARLLVRWYAAASLLFMLVVGVGGAVFLAQRSGAGISWQWPWVWLVLLSGGLLWTLPLGALLEGCNQVAVVNRYRVIQAISANTVVWGTLALGFGLWVAVAAAAMRLVTALYLVGVRYGHFFRSLGSQSPGEAVDWRAEIWPLQWRVALQGIFGYLAFSLFTPVMFHYHGPAVAGRMGMTWTIVTTLHSAALAWMQTRVPRFGMLISRGRFETLDRDFRRLTLISLSAATAGALGLWSVIYLLNAWDISLAERLLSPLPAGLFLAAAVVLLLPDCQDFYLRAHKRDPLLAVRLSTYLIIGTSVWLLGSRFGPIGAAVAYLGGIAVVLLPWQTAVWLRCRTEWHRSGRGNG